MRDGSSRGTWCAGLVSVLVLSAAAARAEDVDAGTEKKAPAATVTYDGQPILTFTERIFGYPPARRAADITARLQKHVDSPLFRVEDVHLEDHDNVTTVFWKDELLFTLTDADAAAAQTTREALAENAVAALKEAVEHSE